MGKYEPSDPTASEEKDALEWLDAVQEHYLRRSDADHAAIIKRLLAQPRLPAEPTPELISIMSSARENAESAPMRAAYRALYAELTRKPTKTVEVWRVEYVVKCHNIWCPRIQGYNTKEDAEQTAGELLDETKRYACIRVTGPHQQEVPND